MAHHSNRDAAEIQNNGYPAALPSGVHSFPLPRTAANGMHNAIIPNGGLTSLGETARRWTRPRTRPCGCRRATLYHRLTRSRSRYWRRSAPTLPRSSESHLPPAMARPRPEVRWSRWSGRCSRGPAFRLHPLPDGRPGTCAQPPTGFPPREWLRVVFSRPGCCLRQVSCRPHTRTRRGRAGPEAACRGICQKLLPNENRARNGSVGWVTRPNAGGVATALGVIW